MKTLTTGESTLTTGESTLTTGEFCVLVRPVLNWADFCPEYPESPEAFRVGVGAVRARVRLGAAPTTFLLPSTPGFGQSTRAAKGPEHA